MAIVKTVVYSSKDFMYSAKSNTMTTEASILSHRAAGQRGIFGQIFDDSCDSGFHIMSDKTGREIPFAVDNVVMDEEYGVKEWILKSLDRSVNVTVHVFNT